MRYAATLLLLASCGYSLQAETRIVREEIADLQRRIPPEAPLWIAEGPNRFDPLLEDYSPRIPDPIYLHVLRKLHEMPADAPEAASQGDFDAVACLSDPARFRGRIWRVRGVIAELHAETIDEPRFPLPRAHAGVFLDRLSQPVLFHVTRKPDVLVIGEDRVELHGVFVKVVEYVSASGRRVAAPFFLGKAVRRTA
jgi:hypothetical protein